ncbi:MAG: hypothetical protein J0L62_06170 [Bacteroidetes bacterium]|nr:hypothetical protein [Bacteroidota bacterium]
MGLVFSIPKLINDLFVEGKIQKKIVERKEKILKSLEFISNEGCILQLPGKKYLIYYFAYIGHFIDPNGSIINKIGFIPIFEHKEKLEEILWPVPIIIECKGISRKGDKIVFVTGNDNLIQVESIDEKNKAKFHEFNGNVGNEGNKAIISSMIHYQNFRDK